MTELQNILEKCAGDSPPPCQATCPLHLDIKGYATLIAHGKFEDALKIITSKLPFPGILGRICSRPCETKCARAQVDSAVAVCSLKRSAADFGAGTALQPAAVEEKKERIAIVGSGPAGLMAAYDLRRLGYQVTIFEALPFPGGMMRVGIPEYRLPRQVLQKEIEQVLSAGIELKLNTTVHKLDTLFEAGYKAVFLATGLHHGRKLPIPGADLDGVLDGLSFLRNINLGRKASLGDSVAVIGGGNVAIDAARSALRLGSRKVTIVYRRTRDEMPAKGQEVEDAEHEGIELLYLAAPSRILGKNGKVAQLECQRMELGDYDASGRRGPVPTKDSQFLLDVDAVVSAIGQSSDLSFLGGEVKLDTTSRGTLVADPVTMATNHPAIFAGGDAVNGAASVIHALASGRKAAISIDRYLKGEDLRVNREKEDSNSTRLKTKTEGVARKERVALPTLPAAQRAGNFMEVELGFSQEQARKEAERCLACECRLCVKDCDFLKKYCASPLELASKFQQGYFREKPLIPYSCNLCSACEKVCPEGLNVGDVCKALRYQLVAEGKGPLPQHEFAFWNLNLSTSDKFALAEPDPATGDCRRVFFPGCGLSGYSPSVVLKSYEYLQQRLPGTGIVLYCCGAPVRDLGQGDKLQAILKTITDNLAKMGATEIITGCTNCYQTFKQYAPQLKRRTIYEVIVEQGLPEGINTKEWTFSLHDSCPARDEPQIHDAVRALVLKMGYNIEEMAHSREISHCCGMGGMAGYADIWLAMEATKRRVGEAHFDLLTYCANCRETLANPEVGEKPSLHILDLVFNPNWEQDRLNPPQIGRTRRDNQTQLKSQLVEMISKIKQSRASKAQ